MYQIVKNYEFKKAEDRQPLNSAMRILLPLCLERCKQLMGDQSQAAVSVQKQILKIFYALIQFFLPLDLISNEDFTHWMELIRQIISRPIPEDVNEVDEDERCQTVWWKIKKWALHILARTFDRYGSPGNVTKEYQNFADFYLKTFSQGVLQELLALLDSYRNKQYVSPRVLQQIMNYLNQGVCHAISWKIIRPHMLAITTDVILPLLCHSEEDQQMWEEDPVEYIRIKYDVFEEFYSPVLSAQSLLHSVCLKRKEIMQKAMVFCLQLLTNANLEPRQRAGAMTMIGSVADILLSKKAYKEQIENLLSAHVFPQFHSEHGYLRGRACYMIQHFAAVKFTHEENLRQVVELLTHAVVKDKELPVKVEGAIALQQLLSEQSHATDLLRPQIHVIIINLLEVIRETENDELTTVLQKLVCTFGEDVAPVAVDITTHLAQTFAKVIDSSDSSDSSDDKAIAAMGILNTLDTIVTVMEEQPEIVANIEGIVLDVIGLIVKQNVMEFYEEILSLICSLTTTHISDRMWNVFPMLQNMFENDGFDYFTDMLPALHNYATVDPEKFKSNPAYIETMFNMCKAILTSDRAGEDAEAHAAKLLEVLLLQYKGELDGVLEHLVQVALERLTREIKTCELRGMCLQVVVAALYYNPRLLLEILSKMSLPNSTEPLITSFIKQWIHDVDVFLGLHDRKVCVLGLCTLVSLDQELRPQAIEMFGKQIMPAFIILFEGLERAYKSRAQAEDSEGEDEEEEYEEEEIGDDEDVIDEESAGYLEQLEKNKCVSDYDDDDEDYDMEETLLETYETTLDKEDCPVDEYGIFVQMMQHLPAKDPNWYKVLTENLDGKQKEAIQKVIHTAELRKQATMAKKIEQAGGYQFTQTSVPANFNFSNGGHPQK